MTKAQLIEELRKHGESWANENYTKADLERYLKGLEQAEQMTDEELKQAIESKEDNNMKTNKKADGQAQLVQIEVNGIKYIQTRPGYYYKNENGKQVRIGKSEWEQAFAEYTNIEDDGWDAEQELKDRKDAEDKKDTEAEQNFNGKTEKPATKKASKRRSKNIAYTYKSGETEITLTDKQLIFIERMPEDNFFEHGVESALWIDVYCDTIADEFNAMAVGAMVSTLREKGLINVGVQRINGKKSRYFNFTELGKQVALAIGLKAE